MFPVEACKQPPVRGADDNGWDRYRGDFAVMATTTTTTRSRLLGNAPRQSKPAFDHLPLQHGPNLAKPGCSPPHVVYPTIIISHALFVVCNIVIILDTASVTPLSAWEREKEQRVECSGQQAARSEGRTTTERKQQSKYLHASTHPITLNFLHHCITHQRGASCRVGPIGMRSAGGGLIQLRKRAIRFAKPNKC